MENNLPDPKRVKIGPGVVFTEEEAAKWFIFKHADDGDGLVLELKLCMHKHVPKSKLQSLPCKPYKYYAPDPEPEPKPPGPPVFTLDADF